MNRTINFFILNLKFKFVLDKNDINLYDLNGFVSKRVNLT